MQVNSKARQVVRRMTNDSFFRMERSRKGFISIACLFGADDGLCQGEKFGAWAQTGLLRRLHIDLKSHFAVVDQKADHSVRLDEAIGVPDGEHRRAAESPQDLRQTFPLAGGEEKDVAGAQAG